MKKKKKERKNLNQTSWQQPLAGKSSNFPLLTNASPFGSPSQQLIRFLHFQFLRLGQRSRINKEKKEEKWEMKKKEERRKKKEFLAALKDL